MTTEEEKQLGSAVKSLIDGTDDFEAYFAETIHDLTALAQHIFENLHKCSGVISFLHNRGTVNSSDGQNWGIRSSVWVNQELAILAFRQFLESAKMPILVFKDKDVRLEGAMTSFIANPLPLENLQGTLAKIKAWLTSAEFVPCLTDEFEKKWNKLFLNSKKVVNCLACEGGLRVNETNIWRKMKEKYSFSDKAADEAVRVAKIQFIDTGLVTCESNRSGDEMTYHPTWKWYLARAARSVDETNI